MVRLAENIIMIITMTVLGLLSSGDKIIKCGALILVTLRMAGMVILMHNKPYLGYLRCSRWWCSALDSMTATATQVEN